MAVQIHVAHSSIMRGFVSLPVSPTTVLTQLYRLFFNAYFED